MLAHRRRKTGINDRYETIGIHGLERADEDAGAIVPADEALAVRSPATLDTDNLAGRRDADR